jgi:hypothetical protein
MLTMSIGGAIVIAVIVLVVALSMAAGLSGCPLTWAPIFLVAMIVLGFSSEVWATPLAIVMGLAYVLGLMLNKHIGES